MKQISLMLLLLCGLGQCLAGELDLQVQGKIKEQINTAFPLIVVDNVKDSPISGLYELSAGSTILYASNDGRYLLTGDLLDLQKLDDHNITEAARREARSNILNKVEVKEMVIYRPEQVKGIVTVFTDADCIYCRELHNEVDKLSDLGIEVRYLAFPRHGVGSTTYTKMESVWCSKDRKGAMERLMQNKEVKPMVCENTIHEQMVMGRKMGVTGTPTMIFADGTLMGGYMPAERLAKQAIRHNGMKE